MRYIFVLTISLFVCVYPLNEKNQTQSEEPASKEYWIAQICIITNLHAKGDMAEEDYDAMYEYALSKIREAK